MEVYLQNLPQRLTDQSLREQLDRYTKALSIQDWTCQKPRKKRYGFLSFLHPKDGERFLRHFQKQGQQGSKSVIGSQLTILGDTVICKVSNKTPDPFLLKSLTKLAKDRHKAQQDIEQPIETKLILPTLKLSSGYYDYHHGELAYAPEAEWNVQQGFTKFAKYAIIIEFDGAAGKQRVEIPYRTVEAMTICTQPASIILTLWEAPRLFQIRDPHLVELMESLYIETRPAPSAPRVRLVELSGGTGDHHDTIGQSLVYRVHVSPTNLDKVARSIHERADLTIHYHVPATLSLHRQTSLREGMKNFHEAVQRCSPLVTFDVLYQLEALVKNNFLLPWTVEKLLMALTKRSEMDRATPGFKSSRTVTAMAVRKLFSQIPFPGPDVAASDFDAQEIWNYLEENEKQQAAPGKDLISEKGRLNLTMIHKVNITPTGMTLHGPDPEAKNRILRRFPEHTEYFIRVQFCEEDGADIQFNSKVSNEDVFQRFKNVFKEGINIGARVYQFLGFSHSSLRSHAAWFMAPFVCDGKLQTYFSVISRLGSFQGITSPARCAARIGQAFSETPLAISLDDYAIQSREIPDIKSTDGRRTFSDGVGTISQSVMEAIHATIPQRRTAPTCFQIRWGGAKGMLSLDPRLKGNIMQVRHSMVKFQSTDKTNLEICDMANKPIPMMLNRQTIKILEDMGVSDAWFFRQQDDRLQYLRLITAQIANTVHFLKRQDIADRIGFPQFLRRLDTIGIDYRKDHFMSTVVEAAVLREVRLLKYKARIPVSRGVTLFGIMDETGYLEEGEVYVTFDRSPLLIDDATNLDNRKMIITRSPALHPGDIQLATNIIPPVHNPLRSLKNCIVFSRKGRRDLPSCLSGGDLDGDIYSIIWDPEAVEQCTQVFQPADYPHADPINIGREVKREDMTDFFINFMQTDQLGVIAIKHMILADQRDLGTVDSDCKSLAEMHSTGVDYSKTGRPVDMTKLKTIKMNRYRPDFLSPVPPANIKDRSEISFDEALNVTPDDADEDDGGGPRHLFYESDKINGKLYRAIDERKVWSNDIRTSVDRSSIIWSQLLRYINAECNKKLGGVRWANAKTEAWGIRYAYEDAISNTALDYSDHATKSLTELEIFTGSIFNKTGVQTRRQRDGSIRLKDEFDRILEWTQSMIRDGSYRPANTATDSLALSIACLEVGSMRMQQSSKLRTGRFKDELQSFRVIAACCALKELDAALRDVEDSDRLWYAHR